MMFYPNSIVPSSFKLGFLHYNKPLEVSIIMPWFVLLANVSGCISGDTSRCVQDTSANLLQSIADSNRSSRWNYRLAFIRKYQQAEPPCTFSFGSNCPVRSLPDNLLVVYQIILLSYCAILGFMHDCRLIRCPHSFYNVRRSKPWFNYIISV